MKAQFWSFDAIFSMIIFGSALVILTFVWFGISNQFSLSYGLGLQTLQLQVQSLQRRILLTGAPANWNSVMNVTNITTWSNITVGLGAGSGRRLSLQKIMTLMAISSYNTTTYQASKSLLGVGFDYYIVINSSNSTITIGLPPYKFNPYAIQVARQSAILNGVPATIQIILWTNKSFGVG